MGEAATSEMRPSLELVGASPSTSVRVDDAERTQRERALVERVLDMYDAEWPEITALAADGSDVAGWFMKRRRRVERVAQALGSARRPRPPMRPLP